MSSASNYAQHFDGRPDHLDYIKEEYGDPAIAVYLMFTGKHTAASLGYEGPTDLKMLKTYMADDVQEKIDEWIIEQKKKKEQTTSASVLNESCRDDDINLQYSTKNKKFTGYKTSLARDSQKQFKFYADLTNTKVSDATVYDLERFLNESTLQSLRHDIKTKLLRAIMRLQVGLNISQNRIVNRRILSEFIGVKQYIYISSHYI